MALQPGDENKGPNQAQATSAATPGLTPPVPPLAPGVAEAVPKTPKATEGAGERVVSESSRDYSTSDEEDSDTYADNGSKAGGGHAAASSEPLIPITPTLTVPSAPEPTAVASLEAVKAFLSTPGLHFKSTEEYAQWFTPAAELVLGTTANPEAFKELLVKGLTDTASPEPIIAGVLNAYSQCKNEPEKLELSNALYHTLRKKLGDLMMADRAALKSSTRSSPAPSTTEATTPAVPPIVVRSARTRVSVPDSSAVSDAPKPTRLKQGLMKRLFGKQDKPSASTIPKAAKKGSRVSSNSDTDSTSEGLRFRADKVFTENSDAFKISDDSMSDDDMTDRLKKADGHLKSLEFSGAKTPTQDPSGDTTVLPFIPQKTAQEESASQHSTPKPANGVAGTRPISDPEWEAIKVKLASMHTNGQYEAQLSTNHVSFNEKDASGNFTVEHLRVVRDENTHNFSVHSSQAKPDAKLMIAVCVTAGQNPIFVKSSASAAVTNDLLREGAAIRPPNGPIILRLSDEVLEEISKPEHKAILAAYEKQKPKTSKRARRT